MLGAVGTTVRRVARLSATRSEPLGRTTDPVERVPDRPAPVARECLLNAMAALVDLTCQRDDAEGLIATPAWGQPWAGALKQENPSIATSTRPRKNAARLRSAGKLRTEKARGSARSLGTSSIISSLGAELSNGKKPHPHCCHCSQNDWNYIGPRDDQNNEEHQLKDSEQSK